MIRLPKVILLLIFMPMIFIGCNQSPEEIIYSSDYPSYQTIDEIEENADLIIRGKVVNSTVEEIDVSGAPLPEEALDDEQLNPHPDGKRPKEEALELVYTVSDIKIEEIYKGEYDGDVIQVKQGGGELKKVIHIEEGVKRLDSDQSYVLFLQTYDSVPASLLNPYQAAYLYDGGNIKTHHAENDLPIDHVEKLITTRD